MGSDEPADTMAMKHKIIVWLTLLSQEFYHDFTPF
jgi:hypothetical protein